MNVFKWQALPMFILLLCMAAHYMYMVRALGKAQETIDTLFTLGEKAADGWKRCEDADTVKPLRDTLSPLSTLTGFSISRTNYGRGPVKVPARDTLPAKSAPRLYQSKADTVGTRTFYTAWGGVQIDTSKAGETHRFDEWKKRMGDPSWSPPSLNYSVHPDSVVYWVLFFADSSGRQSWRNTEVHYVDYHKIRHPSEITAFEKMIKNKNQLTGVIIMDWKEMEPELRAKK